MVAVGMCVCVCMHARVCVTVCVCACLQFYDVTVSAGLVFLVVFGFLFFLQFLTMLWHRLSTVSHYLARAPYR